MPKQKKIKLKKKNLSSLSPNVSYGEDNPKDEFGKWILERIQILLKTYGMGRTNIYLHYLKDNQRGEISNGDMVFAVSSNNTYKNLHLHVYPIARQMFKDKQQAKLMSGLAHEIAHMITTPLERLANARFVTQNEIMEVNEETTETIAQLCRDYLLITKPELFT